MPQELPAAKTPVSNVDMFTALGMAWTTYFHETPTKEQLCILLAHWAFETGWGRGMWNFNVGNAKSHEGDGRDYSFFACTEVMGLNAAKTAVSTCKIGKAEIVAVTPEGRATVRYSPPNPTTRFRAFETLSLGALDYLDMIVSRFSDDEPVRDAWHWVLQAVPAAFCHALKLKGYYTGDEGIYTSNVSYIYRGLLDQPFDVSSLPTYTNIEQEQLANWQQVVLDEGRELAFQDEEASGGTDDPAA